LTRRAIEVKSRDCCGTNALNLGIEENERVLRASRLFATLDGQLVHHLAQSAVRTRCVRGDYVWRAGEPATHFTIIANGLVRISRTAADGAETILALFGPRESVGDVAVLGMKKYPADAVALTDTLELLRVDGATVRESFAANPSLMAAMNASLIEHTQALQDKIRIMTAGTVDKRLSTLLLHLATRFGDELEDGTTFVPVQLSRAECARLVGATVETTIRTFSKWQKAGIVETTPSGFALHDVAALTSVTES
jgi:CRP-like cAMP-binding protein